MKRGIVSGSGGYRTVFIHGVLSIFEKEGFRGDAYGGISASGLTSVAAAVGKCAEVGIDYWYEALELKHTMPRGMSDVMLESIQHWGANLSGVLFQAGAPRYVIPASYVKTEAGAEVTQSEQARRLGRKLLLSAARRQPNEWVIENLESHLFDTDPDAEHRLTPENFHEVMYATTRMMHAWDVPATIAGKPYVDGSYLNAIPAVELAERGYDEIIAIAADPPGALYRDVFGTRIVPEEVNGARIHIILPDADVGPQGADFTDATKEGLLAVYEQGQAKAYDFLKKY